MYLADLTDDALWREAYIALNAYTNNNNGENAVSYRTALNELKRRKLWPISEAEKRKRKRGEPGETGHKDGYLK